MKWFRIKYTDTVEYTIPVCAESKAEARDRVRRGLEDATEPIRCQIVKTAINEVEEIEGLTD